MKKTVLCLSAVILLSTSVMAHEGASGVVKTRMDMMKDVAKSMKSIASVLKDEDVNDLETIKASASVIVKHSGHFKKLFPEGSNQEPTEAAPSIWEKKDEFDKLFSDMSQRAQKLVNVDETTGLDVIKADFKTLGTTCGTCHKAFRIEK